MKKPISFVLALLLMFVFACTAMAEQVAPDAQGLFAHWEANGYPDDVGGVYYNEASGKLVIMLVGADANRQQEILAMIGDPKSVEFGESKYSHNQMLAVQEEITAQMVAGSGIHAVGVGWASINGEVKGFGGSGKESRVVVTVDKSVYKKYSAEFASRYGDMVYVETGDAVVPLDAGVSGNPWLLPAVIALTLAATATAIALNRRRVAAMQTSNGATVTGARHISRQEVIESIKASELKPSESAHARLMERLDRE